jgi:hypothetical protein
LLSIEQGIHAPLAFQPVAQRSIGRNRSWRSRPPFTSPSECQIRLAGGLVRLGSLQQLTNLALALQSGNGSSPKIQCLLVARFEFQDPGGQRRNILKMVVLKCCAGLFQDLGNAFKLLQLLLRTILELLQPWWFETASGLLAFFRHPSHLPTDA